jgi:hypothetical protein
MADASPKRVLAAQLEQVGRLLEHGRNFCILGRHPPNIRLHAARSIDAGQEAPTHQTYKLF